MKTTKINVVDKIDFYYTALRPLQEMFRLGKKIDLLRQLEYTKNYDKKNMLALQTVIGLYYGLVITCLKTVAIDSL